MKSISQRPHAFESVRPIRRWRADWPASQEKRLERFREANGRNHGVKEFIGVLMLFTEHGHKEVIEAVEAAVIAGVSSREVMEPLLRMESGAGHDYSPTPLGTWPTLPSPAVLWPMS